MMNIYIAIFKDENEELTIYAEQTYGDLHYTLENSLYPKLNVSSLEDFRDLELNKNVALDFFLQPDGTEDHPAFKLDV
jgi:hypothetical protein